MAKKDTENTTRELTLDRFENETAVLICNGKECFLPVTILPKGVKEGDILEASFSTAEEEREKREKKAKEILNEILNIR